MGGDDSQKLLPWRGMILLSGAQTSGLLRIQHCSGKLRGRGDLVGLPRPKPAAAVGLSYKRTGSLLVSRPGSILPRAEARERPREISPHKVSFEEAATVFGDPLGRIVADPRH